jgi:hypothetical protein
VTNEKHYYDENISSPPKDLDTIEEFQKAIEQYEQNEEILFRHRNKQWKDDDKAIRELGRYVDECLDRRLQRRMTTRSMTRMQDQDDVFTPEERGMYFAVSSFSRYQKDSTLTFSLERVESYWQPVMDAMTVEKRLQKELTTLEAEITTRFKWAKFEGSLRL